MNRPHAAGKSSGCRLGSRRFLAAVGNGSGQRRGRHITAQQFSNAFAQLFHREVALDLPAHRQADGSGFLGNDHGNRVGLFGHADAGTMPGAQLRREHRIHGERQKTGCRRNPVFLHDHGAIMQRRAGAENRGQQVVGKMRIQGDAALNVGAQPDFPLDHNQGAGLVLGEQVGCQYDVVVGVRLRRGRPAEQKPSSQPRQGLSYLCRKDHDQREHCVRQECAEQPVQSGEFADPGKVKRQRQRRHAHQHVGGARPFDERQQFVNDERDQQDVNDRNHRQLRPRRCQEPHLRTPFPEIDSLERGQTNCNPGG